MSSIDRKGPRIVLNVLAGGQVAFSGRAMMKVTARDQVTEAVVVQRETDECVPQFVNDPRHAVAALRVAGVAVGPVLDGRVPAAPDLEDDLVGLLRHGHRVVTRAVPGLVK